ncbi:MAG: SMP-30/gluconolactonase/LRE family protein [Ilumatobacteraceae bacterium]|nr:SMP-30/gluconolactonase/LRE family protein [Ilumatobacter sp.]MCO5329496.1 SMP-30/gluconolactonase/LRE family protein [Ilumatobacteraceae bacterium]
MGAPGAEGRCDTGKVVAMSVDVLADGLYFGEGPRWHHGMLWFSDFYDHAVKTVDMDGRVATMLELDDQPSGLGWMPDGRMLVVSMTQRRLLRLEGDALVVHADLDAIATFHCNDMVVDAAGRAYVGNFGFDLDAAVGSGDFAGALAAYEGASIARVDPDGSVHEAATGLRFPNGTVITPDGSTMIVAESLGRRLSAFDIAKDGSLSNQRVWADLGTAVPDGICMDADGAVWLADAGGDRCLRVVEGGAVLAEVPTGDPCFACMLGGPDGRTLFMLTAVSSRPHEASAARTGAIRITEVDVPRAGRP